MTEDEAASRRPWLAVIDPQVRELSGHFIPLAVGCLRAARRRGFRTLLACGAGAPDFLDEEADMVQRVFAAPPAAPLPFMRGLARKRWVDRGMRAVRLPGDAGPVAVVLPTFTPDFCWALSRRLADPAQVRGMIAMYHETPPPKWVRVKYHLLARKEIPVVHGLFHRSFRKGMNDATGVRHIGLPHPFDWAGFGEAPEADVRRDTILFAGVLRIDKGAAEMVELIRSLLPDAERLGFRILCYAVVKEKACLPIRGELERMAGEHPVLVLRTVPATDAEMREDYRRTAAAVLSYDPKIYRAKTSGILMETTVAGAPVVVSRGTHMERMIREGHAAGVAVDHHDREAWRRGVVQVLESASRYQEQAGACSAWWRRFWNGDRFLRHGLRALAAAERQLRS
jgi:hypothetical protein